MEMRIYVACLASYNNGRLHGRWIEASTDVAEMQMAVSAMLRESPYPNVMRTTYQCECGTARVVTNSFGEGFAPSIECDECGDRAPMDGDPYRSAEEWAIHDHEGLGDLGEYAGLGEVARRASLAELAEERDIPLTVLLEFASDHMSGEWDADDLESELDDRYSRKAESWKEFAQEWTEEVQDMSEVPEWVRYHIDWDSIARDFEICGDFSAYRDGEFGDLYIFHAN
jgi:antirestriction protein